MSSEIPSFDCGDRMQAMQVSDNVELGIDAVCGVVLEQIGNKCHCFMENGKFVLVDRCSMNHILEETYERWKSNGVETHKTAKERK